MVSTVIQASRIQVRKEKNGERYYVYLSARYNELWRKVKEKNVPVIVRIEIPEDLIK